MDLRRLHAQHNVKGRETQERIKADANIKLSMPDGDETPHRRTVTTEEQATMQFSLVGTRCALRSSDPPTALTRRERTPRTGQAPLSPVPVPRLRIEAAQPRGRGETSMRRDTMPGDTTDAKDTTIKAEDTGAAKPIQELTLMTQQNDAVDSAMRISNRD